MNPFVSHPSVRIKGTENNYEPCQCIDTKCDKSWPHMHCPFCVKSEVFQDPVILKAHYRVKHVDKGIEFAGLKILRCCEHCDIVGTIKGTKEFKGAHWHCYRCRNGFTRRDEAIKHYKTHFRNPSTTFQIQIAQDINQTVYQMKETNSMVENVSHDMHLIETVVSSASMENVISIQPVSPTEVTKVDCQDSEKSHSGEMQVSVAANETVGTCEGQTVMIIHEGTHLEEGEVVNTLETLQVNNTKHTEKEVRQNVNLAAPEVRKMTGHWRQEKALLEMQIREMKAQNSKLTAEKQQIEEQLKAEIENLKVQLQVTNADIAAYQKREAELLNQIKIPLDERISVLLNDLKTQHEELLHHQLAHIRRTYLNQLTDEVSTSDPKSPTQADHDIIDAKGFSMAVVLPMAGDSIGTVMTPASGDKSIVLTAPDGYSVLSTSSLHGENIMLTSEAVTAEGGRSGPLFVVSQATLDQIKSENTSNMVSEQTVMMNNTLLESEDPNAPTLVQYSESENKGVESATCDNLGDKILLGTPVVSDISSNHVQLTDKADSIHMNFDSVNSTTQIQIDQLLTSGKRKLDADSSDASTVKQRKEV